MSKVFKKILPFCVMECVNFEVNVKNQCVNEFQSILDFAQTPKL